MQSTVCSSVPVSSFISLQASCERGVLNYSTVPGGSDRRKFSGKVRLIEPRGVSIISDIDDTVKVSEVLDRSRLISRTFLEEFVAVEGIAEAYRKIATEENAVFHFVSSSPWHLYRPLMQFLEQHSFPQAELHLKAFRFRDSSLRDLFKSGLETKPPVIRSILKRYPHRTFILIGDSGEEDPEAYAQIVREFPKQIRRVLIRSVREFPNDYERMQKIFAGLDRDKWHLFRNGHDLAG